MSLFSLVDAFSPEITLSVGLLMMAIFVQKEKNKYWRIDLLYFITLVASLYATKNYKAIPEYASLFSFSNELLWLKRILLGLGVAAGSLISIDAYKAKQEIFMLITASLIGALLLVQSNHFFIFYLSIELMSLPIYALVALSGQEHSGEAAIKYMLQGALVTSIFLFTLSFYYGVEANSFSFSDLRPLVFHESPIQALTYAGLLGLILFKLGLFPFHYWVPDVYQQVRPSLIFFLVSIPKIAIIGLLFKISGMLFNYVPLQYVMTVISLLSAVLGSYASLQQQSLQRLLGYASIAQISWILASFSGGAIQSFAPILYYLMIYAVTMFCSVLILITSFKNTVQIKINDLKELVSYSPALTGLLCLLFISFAGIPPFPGFFAKFYIISGLLSNKSMMLGAFLLLLTGVSCAVYLRIILTFFKETKLIEIKCIDETIETKRYIVLGVTAFLFVLIGLLPFSLFQFF